MSTLNSSIQPCFSRTKNKNELPHAKVPCYQIIDFFIWPVKIPGKFSKLGYFQSAWYLSAFCFNPYSKWCNIIWHYGSIHLYSGPHFLLEASIKDTEGSLFSLPAGFPSCSQWQVHFFIGIKSLPLGFWRPAETSSVMDKVRITTGFLEPLSMVDSLCWTSWTKACKPF